MIKKYQKAVFFASFLLLLVLVFFIVRPFLEAIFFGAVLAYLFHPACNFLNRYLKQKSVSSAIIVLLVLAVFAASVYLVLNMVSGDITTLYSNSVDKVVNGDFFVNPDCSISDGLICRITNKIHDALDTPYIKDRAIESVSNIFSSIFSSLSNLIISIPLIIINILIFIFIFFYMMRDWKEIMKKIDGALPFKEELRKELKKQTKDIIYAAIFGTLVVAVVQGSLGTVAFIIFDSTKAPFFWGVVMMFAALLPFVGTALVWLPISVIQIISGYASGSPDVMWKGVGMFLVGALIISTIDNVIKPKIIGNRASIHPLLVFFGVFGGMMMMGFMGLFIGPIIISFFLAFLRVYMREKNEITG